MEALKHLLEALFSLKSPFKSLLRIKFLFFHDEFFSSIRLRWLPKANSLVGFIVVVIVVHDAATASDVIGIPFVVVGASLVDPTPDVVVILYLMLSLLFKILLLSLLLLLLLLVLWMVLLKLLLLLFIVLLHLMLLRLLKIFLMLLLLLVVFRPIFWSQIRQQTDFTCC